MLPAKVRIQFILDQAIDGDHEKLASIFNQQRQHARIHVFGCPYPQSVPEFDQILPQKVRIGGIVFARLTVKALRKLANAWGLSG